ncbi:MAG: metal ABC transporter ATP-binding protein [Acidimicrobiales bacterium]|nr:metal ABC transporter ATP-binding protein [Acidimicrobiales bacterium]
MTTPPRNTPAQTVNVEDLVVRYGGRVALEGVNLSLHAGQATSLIGPNGSGKSTLLNALAGLHRPDRGSVKVLGERPEAVRADIAYVLQATTTGAHLPVTAREAVAMGRYAHLGPLRRFSADDRRLVDEALDRLDLLPLAKRHLNELSGGQRQRVFVAQGLVQHASVLLLDEPLAGLDLASQKAILDVVAQERDRGVTVVTSTHDLGEAATADHLVLLAGRLVAAGTPEEVLTAEHLAAAYRGAVLRLADGSIMVDDGAHHHHEADPADEVDHGRHEHRADEQRRPPPG